MCRDYGKGWNPKGPFITFRDGEGEQLGQLWYKEGKFTFEGDADASVDSLMRALNTWGENFVPRAHYEYQRAQLENLPMLKKHAQTLAEYMTRIKLSTSNRDNARTDKHLAQAMHYIDEHSGEWAS